MKINQAIQYLKTSQNLSADDVKEIFRQIMSGECSDKEIEAFLLALKEKGETVDEMTAAVEVMQELAIPVQTACKPLIDIVGTGGDGINTFNISTASSFVLAAAGACVAKHGNRSVSSTSGSADVLEKAGVNLKLSLEKTTQALDDIGIAFLFAQNHHLAMKHVAQARKNLGQKTIFNLLGPLLNPANTPFQIIGVSNKKWLMPFAKVCAKLGRKHVMIVHSRDGMDEFSICQTSDVIEYKDGKFLQYSINPRDYNLSHESLEDLLVSTPEQSLEKLYSVFNNTPGPCLDIVLLNTGCAIYVAGLANNIETGINKAREIINNGLALETFKRYILFTQKALS